jgi:hypothetical protein
MSALTFVFAIAFVASFAVTRQYAFIAAARHSRADAR